MKIKLENLKRSKHLDNSLFSLFACPPCVCVRYSGFLPQLTGDSKLPVFVNASVNDCFYVNWQFVQFQLGLVPAPAVMENGWTLIQSITNMGDMSGERAGHTVSRKLLGDNMR